jgi:hypothetical protein
MRITGACEWSQLFTRFRCNSFWIGSSGAVRFGSHNCSLLWVSVKHVRWVCSECRIPILLRKKKSLQLFKQRLHNNCNFPPLTLCRSVQFIIYNFFVATETFLEMKWKKPSSCQDMCFCFFNFNLKWYGLAENLHILGVQAFFTSTDTQCFLFSWSHKYLNLPFWCTFNYILFYMCSTLPGWEVTFEILCSTNVHWG